MRAWIVCAAIVVAIAVADPAHADDLLRYGRVATLAPLCGLRDEAWSFDLRRAELQTATGSAGFDDGTLAAAPGSRQVVAALSSAEHEALEEFAEGSPARTCGALQSEDDFGHSDEIVRAFRDQRVRSSGS